MTTPRATLAMALFLLAAGCKTSGESPTQGQAASSQPVGSALAPAAAAAPSAPAPSAAAPSKPGGCPTAVPGATATVADTAGGVALTIAAKDPAAAADVRDRAHGLAQLAQTGLKGGQGGGGGGGDGTGPGPGDGSGKGASGGGGGGGGLGRCPVLVRSTTVDVQDTKDGAVITMRPRNANDLDSVRKQVRARLAGN